jgi:phosphatidylglycerol:prolipoprotein diacylglycerol transferase
VLIDLGFISVKGYGLMIAVGFLIALTYAGKSAEKAGLDGERLKHVLLLSFAAGFVGGRLMFVITQFDHYLANPLDIFAVWKGGFVFYGGIILAFIVASGVPLAHAFGRLGCFLAGCCHGKIATDLPWAVTFSHPDSLAHPLGVPMHPTQLYEAFATALLFLFLHSIRNKRLFDGMSFLTYIGLYAIIRSVIEEFRGDKIRGFVVGQISTSQFVSILTFCFALAVGVYLYRRQKKNS